MPSQISDRVSAPLIISMSHLLSSLLQPHDPVEAARDPLQTRPISLESTDNKLATAADVKALEPQYKVITHTTQNRFVSGRNFFNNLVDLYSWQNFLDGL